MRNTVKYRFQKRDKWAETVPSTSKRLNKLQKTVVVLTGLLTIIVGFVVLAGWIYQIPLLKSLHPNYISMKANTAICFVILGCVILLLKKTNKSRFTIIFARILLAIVASICLITFFEYLVQWNSGIDEVLFKDYSSNNRTLYPGRMAFNTCICFLLLVFSLLFNGTKIKSLAYISHLLPLATCLFSIVPILGYIYSADELFTFAFYTDMALHTAVTILVLSLGVICLRPSLHLFSILALRGPGGYVARRLLPITILIPVLFIWIKLLLYSNETKADNLNILILSLLYLAIFSFFILRVARAVNDLEVNREHVQMELTRSEQRFYLIFHSSPAALVITDFANGIIKDSNKAYSNLVGFSSNELKGKSTTGLKIWEDPSERNRILHDLAINGSVKDFEIRIRNGEGQIRFVLASFEQIYLQGEKCILSSAIDITEMKSFQERILSSEGRFRSTLDTMMEGCQLLGFDWHYLYINGAAEKHNRRPSEELIGKTYMDVWPGVINTSVFRLLQDCMLNRISHIIVNEFVFQDGTKGWFDLRIQPVPEGIFILSTDITEHILTENYNLLANEILENLNRNTDSRVMINSIINSIKIKTGYEAIAIRVKEGDDYPYYETIGFNEEFVEAERNLCSFDKNGNVILDSDGKPLLECMCGNILCNRVDPSKSFFTEGGSFRSNNTTLLLASTTPEERLARTRNRCNSSGYESVALIPLRSGNEIIGLLQLNDHRKDVFDEEIIPFFERLGSSIGIALMRNRAENQIKKLNEDLENRVGERTLQLMDSNKELESFAYSVSHDLRAPLRHVIGFSEKLESELKGRMDPEITRLTDKIKNSASKMSRLIDELLTYSRLGRTDLKTATLSLNPIIDEVIKEAQDITINRNIKWKINELPKVKADITLIKLVLQNLINNSIKFTSKKKIAVIEINFEEKNEKGYTFYVKDNGAGFKMEYVDKLFGVFQRLHTTEEFEGTGIGLAIVRRIVKRLGGEVWAEGIENNGATFYFTLPKYTA